MFEFWWWIFFYFVFVQSKTGAPSKKKVCVPEIKAARVIYHETDNGFQFDYAEYPDTPAVHHDKRTLVQLAGVRVSFHTSGTGGAFSIVDIVFRIAMVLALLTIANVVVDFFMCWIAPRSRQNYNRKYEMTPDFTGIIPSLFNISL